MYRVPDSDDSVAPSTPDRSRQSFAGPSTTPAGPPPSHSRIGLTSTPAGAPPATGLFGGTRPDFNPKPYNFNNSLFGSSPPKNDILEGSGPGQYASQRGRTTSSAFGRLPDPIQHAARDVDQGMEDEDAEGSEDDDMDDTVDDEQPQAQRRTRMRDSFSQSLASRSSVDGYTSTGKKVVRSGAKLQQYDLLSLAKGLKPSTDRVVLSELDHDILETERILGKLHDSLEEQDRPARNELLGDVAHELLSVWRISSTKKLVNASIMAELLLGIHHPGRLVIENRDLLSSQALSRPGSEPLRPVPKVLLDWLNTHRPVDEETYEVLDQEDGYSSHVSFWDVVQTTALRGKFLSTIELLNGANFAVAYTAGEDEDTLGYKGPKLSYATQAAQEAINLLNQCPGLHDDWHVKGHDWTIFRQRVHQAKRDLEDFAEGESQSRFSMSQSLGGSHFGLSQSRGNFSLSTHSRKVECKVPWSVYEQLLKLYDLLLGDEEEIITWSQTWVEATLCLTIWWNGEGHEHIQGNPAASRPSLAQSYSPQVADVDAYSRRLSASLAAILDIGDDEFTLNTTNIFEVGVACIIDDNVEGALHIVRSQSLVASSALAEIADAGGWLKLGGVFSQLNQSDLLLLSYNQPSQNSLSKDDLLAAYADQLSSKDQLSGRDRSVSRSGWELAIGILGRLSNTVLANERIQRILDELPLTSAEQVDKVTQLCHNMGLSNQALGIALVSTEDRAMQLHISMTLLLFWCFVVCVHASILNSLLLMHS